MQVQRLRQIYRSARPNTTIFSNLGQLDETGRGLSDVGSNLIGTSVILRVVHCSLMAAPVQVQVQCCRCPDLLQRFSQGFANAEIWKL